MSVAELKLSLAGFGRVGRGFARLLLEKERYLRRACRVACRVTGIATARHGSLIDEGGIDLRWALRRIEKGDKIGPDRDTVSFIKACPAEILFEITLLNPRTGQPAIRHIKAAFASGKHVVTANKGPIAIAYKSLQAMAERRKLLFRFEGAVMDGAPIFNLVRHGLPATKVLGFRGILNSTTNIILSAMERGATFGQALKRAQDLGIAEANPDYDVDGWDAASKAAALANVLMGANIKPAQVDRKGIRGITGSDLARARRLGKRIKLVARASRRGRAVEVSVAPEMLPATDVLASTYDSQCALTLATDTMREITIFEGENDYHQTAYALFSDMVDIVRETRSRNVVPQTSARFWKMIERRRP